MADNNPAIKELWNICMREPAGGYITAELLGYWCPSPASSQERKERWHVEMNHVFAPLCFEYMSTDWTASHIHVKLPAVTRNLGAAKDRND